MAAIPPPGYFRLFNSYWALLEFLLLCAFAFFFCFACGQRGLFPLDQSIVWDGAYRILVGQQPFRDFLLPHSLLVVHLQALSFKLLGSSFYSYLVPAALMNVLAVVSVMRIVALLYPAARAAALTAGILTAVWFLPAFGTPYGEHVAFLLGLLGFDLLLTAILDSDETKRSGSRGKLFVAGLFAGSAFFAKQNIAVFLWPFFLLSPAIAWLPDSRRCFDAVKVIVAGLCVALLVPMLWITIEGNWRSFVYFYMLLPLATALRRMSSSGSGVLSPQTWALGAGIFLVLATAIFSVRRKLAAGWWHLLDVRSRFLNESLAAWTTLYVLLLSYAVRRSMLNNPTIADVYMGLLFGLVLALVSARMAGGIHSNFARSLLGLAILAGAFGVFVDWDRRVQESVSGSAFGDALASPGLEGLRWGIPTRIGEPGKEVSVSQQELLDLVAYLQRDGRNFFIFPDFTFMYAVVGTMPPQPLLFFHRGLTYPEHYDRDIDNLVVDTLITNQVAVIVVEERSFFGTAGRMADFPVLASFIHSNFNESKRIGIFSVLTLKTLDEAMAEGAEAD